MMYLGSEIYAPSKKGAAENYMDAFFPEKVEPIVLPRNTYQ